MDNTFIGGNASYYTNMILLSEFNVVYSNVVATGKM